MISANGTLELSSIHYACICEMIKFKHFNMNSILTPTLEVKELVSGRTANGVNTSHQMLKNV